MPDSELSIGPAAPAEADAILALQRLCYQSEAQLYNNFSIPPLTETLEDLKVAFGQSTILVCRSGSEIVGSVRGRVRDGRCHVGRLIVHPSFQKRGIGTRLLGAIEDACPEAAAFELFTGHKSESNLRLYRRVGYRDFKTEAAGPDMSLVFLEKPAG